jgi:hypothetical protein
MNDAVRHLADAARALSAADRERLLSELQHLTPTRRELNQQRDDRLRAIRLSRYPALGVNDSARQVWGDVKKYRAGQFRHDQHLIALPAGSDARRRELFDLLKLGRKLSYATIRRAFLGSKTTLDLNRQITDESRGGAGVGVRMNR